MSSPNRNRLGTVAASFAACGLVLSMPTYASDPLSDPTRPPAAINPAIQSRGKDLVQRPLELQAILHAEGRRVAIINGKRVRENETIEDARILDIGRNRVRMVREGQSIELSLKNERIKKTESLKTRSRSRDSATEGILK